jgi:hypothetical protein
MTGVLAVLAGMGGAVVLDTKSVTVGTASTGTDPFQNWVGFKSFGSPTFGSINNSTSAIYSANIVGVYFFEEGTTAGGTGYYLRSVSFVVSGTHSNSGWGTIRVGSTDFTRASASFFQSGGNTIWEWALPIPNPFASGSPGPFTSSPTSVVWTA